MTRSQISTYFSLRKNLVIPAQEAAKLARTVKVMKLKSKILKAA